MSHLLRLQKQPPSLTFLNNLERMREVPVEVVKTVLASIDSSVESEQLAALKTLITEHARNGDHIECLLRYVEHGLLPILAKLIKKDGGTQAVQLAVLKVLMITAQDVDSELKRQVVDSLMGSMLDRCVDENPEICQSALNVMRVFSRYGHSAVRIMVLGGIPVILTNLKSNPANMKQAAAILAHLSLNSTVRTLVGELLLENVENIKQLIRLCKAHNIDTACYASVAVSLLMLNPANAVRLNGQRAEEFLDAFCQNNPLAPDFAFDMRENDLSRLVALLASPLPQVQTVFLWCIARHSSNDTMLSPNCAGLFSLIRSRLVSTLLSFAFGLNARQRELAALALVNIHYPVYDSRKSVEAWLESLDLGYSMDDPSSGPVVHQFNKAFKKEETNHSIISKTFRREGIDMVLLLNPELSPSELESLVFIGSDKISLRLKMLTSLRRIRFELQQAREERVVLGNEAQQAESLPVGGLTGDQHTIKNLTISPSSPSVMVETPRSTSNTTALLMQDKQVFISYSWYNKPAAKQLKKILEEAGLSCWMDENQLTGGTQLFDAIDDGITNCKVVISCVSDKYGMSENCRKEIRLAADRNKLIIPVLVDSCSPFPPRGDMGPLLAGKLYVDMSTAEKFAASAQQLVQALTNAI